MLEIQALVPEDGWAIVRDGDQTLMVRPPYEKSRRQVVDAQEARRAVTARGFSVPIGEIRFTDWRRLFAHLNEQIEQSRARVGRSLELEGLGERLLPHAPEPVLRYFLDRIERELLPDPGSVGAADRLLRTMLELPRMRKSTELMERAAARVGELRRKRTRSPAS